MRVPRPVWARLTGVALVAAAGGGLGALAGSGCGTSYPLPTEVFLTSIPGDRTYQRIQTWPGMDGITDLLLIPGPQLYLLFRAVPGQPARVLEYKTTAPEALPTRFDGAINPGGLAFGGNRIFVLDQGDTASARTNLPCLYSADCGTLRGFSRPIADLSKYWHVREYLLDGTLTSTFTDTAFAAVNGIAADDFGQVYLAGVLIYCRVDPFEFRTKSLDWKYHISRYKHGAGGSSVIGPWDLDPSFEVVQGTGIGSTRDPHGLFWANQGGASLYVSDSGNNEVQKYDPLSLLNSFQMVFGGSGPDSVRLAEPLDVAVDRAGYVYVADTGNRRVLRYDPEGTYIQRVDIEPDLNGIFLDTPVAVAADTDQVYVADPGTGVVARFRRRK